MSAGLDARVCVWKSTTGRERHSVAVNRWPLCLAYDAVSGVALVGLVDHPIVALNCETGEVHTHFVAESASKVRKLYAMRFLVLWLFVCLVACCRFLVGRFVILPRCVPGRAPWCQTLSSFNCRLQIVFVVGDDAFGPEHAAAGVAPSAFLAATVSGAIQVYEYDANTVLKGVAVNAPGDPNQPGLDGGGDEDNGTRRWRASVDG